MDHLFTDLSSKDLIIAIDGYAACGKSTLARAMARALHYRYIDSGAMYRAVTLFFIQNQIDPDDPKAVMHALPGIDIDFQRVNGENHTILNGNDVEQEIRTSKVNNEVSKVAAISAVRKVLVDQQQKMGKDKRLVMDGRDIGTVVFPDADLKLFVEAGLEIRTERRRLELEKRGTPLDTASVMANLEERDRIDTTRADSPLTKADDAIVLDTSFLSPEEQLLAAMRILGNKVIREKA